MLSTPPIASAPPSKEADLRSIGALLADPLHTQPVRLAEAPLPSANDGAPYFLGLAGMPAASSLPPQGSLPSSAQSASALPGGAPATPSAPASAHELASTSPAPAGSAPTAEALPLGAPLPSSAIPGSSDLGVTEFTPRLYAYQADEVKAPRHSSSLFDPYAVKRDFPILRQRVHGRELVWLDNAATTQKPNAVIERLKYYYEHENSNIHRAAHELAARATDAYEGARESVRRFLNAPTREEIVFTRGTTEAINLVAKSWGAANIGEGDEILITHLEHHANIVPWQQLCAATGAVLRVAPVDDNGDVIVEEFARLIGPRTKLASFTQVSNAFGTVTPAAEMIGIAHANGVPVLLDAAQSVAHVHTDVSALDVDFLVFSGHKIYGPTGIGAPYAKRAILESMPPWEGGGNMIEDVTFEKTVFHGPPARFEAGTGNIADAVGLSEALDYVSARGIDAIGAYEHRLIEYLVAQLAGVRSLRFIGSPTLRAGALSFVVEGRTTQEVGEALNRDGIAVRSGHHCAQPILRRFGVETSVRPSLALYNTAGDVDALVTSLNRIVARG